MSINISKPLVTIVCVTYNHKLYIRQCIDGFMMQKTNFVFDVLIHDDASSDGTAEIIREYEKMYPHIIKPIYQKENQYSKGIDVSVYIFPRLNSKYIAWCEGDDYWIDPVKLQRQVAFMESHENYSMCFHNVWKLENSKMNKFSSLRKEEIYASDIINDWIVPTCSILFKRNCFNIDDYYKISCVVGDFNLFINLSQNGKIHYINSIMGVYRIHSNGITSISLKRMVSQDAFLKQIDKMSRVYTNVRGLLREQYASAALSYAYVALKNHNIKYFIYFLYLALRRKNILVLKSIFIRVKKKAFSLSSIL